MAGSKDSAHLLISEYREFDALPSSAEETAQWLTGKADAIEMLDFKAIKYAFHAVIKRIHADKLDKKVADSERQLWHNRSANVIHGYGLVKEYFEAASKKPNEASEDVSSEHEESEDGEEGGEEHHESSDEDEPVVEDVDEEAAGGPDEDSDNDSSKYR